MNYDGINKDVVNFAISPRYMTEFINRNFSECNGKIPCAELWRAFQNPDKLKNKFAENSSKAVLFYVMERDGWKIKRYSDTNYFIAPGTKPKRGRPTESETITRLKARIASLEAENKRLKTILSDRETTGETAK